MITNIIIGKQSFVTKALLNFIKKAEVFSANDFDAVAIKSIQSKKKINHCLFCLVLFRELTLQTNKKNIR